MFSLLQKAYNYVLMLAIEYYQAKQKRYKFGPCSYCGKKYLFDVTENLEAQVPISEIIFECSNCAKNKTPGN